MPWPRLATLLGVALLAACASKPTPGPTVRVPVPTPCVTEIPNEPDYDPIYGDIYTSVRALLINAEKRQTHIKTLRAILWGCQRPPRSGVGLKADTKHGL